MDDNRKKLMIQDLKERIELINARTKAIEEREKQLQERKEKLYSSLIQSGVSHGVLILKHQQNTAHHEEANSPYGTYFQPRCAQHGIWRW